MKYGWLMMFVFGLGYSQTSDAQMRAILKDNQVAKVEAETKKTDEKISWKCEKPADKGLAEAIEKYFQFHFESDSVGTYAMMVSLYKEKVSLGKHARKEQLDMTGIELLSVSKECDSVFLVTGRMSGKQHRLGSISVPFREFFVYEGDAFLVHKNPYPSLMGMPSPLGKKFEDPCQSSKKKEATKG